MIGYRIRDCGNCGSTQWVLRQSDNDPRGWNVACANGHELIPSGAEYLIDIAPPRRPRDDDE